MILQNKLNFQPEMVMFFPVFLETSHEETLELYSTYIQLR